jgi:putative transposase
MPTCNPNVGHRCIGPHCILLEEGEEKTREVINAQGEREVQVERKGMKTQQVSSEMDRLSAGKDVALRKMLRWKIRYFTDSGVVGSRAFVESMFEQSRDRFGPKRKTGARKMRGKAAGVADLLWTERDLRLGIG